MPPAYRSVAAIYDIHGNLGALEAVLARVARHAVDAVVIGGDIAFGPQPAAVLDRVRTLPWPTFHIRGNTDREIVEGGSATPWVTEVGRWCRARLTAEQIDFLGHLPLHLTLAVHGLGDVLFVHASPRDDNEAIRASTPESEVRPMLAGVGEPLVVCGHTHIQFDRRVGRHRLVNAGSVGLQSCARGACWALLGPEVRLCETPYDSAAQAEFVGATGMPMADALARHLLDPPLEPPWPEGPKRSHFVP